MKPTSTPQRWRLACAAIGTATLALCASVSAATVPAPWVDVDLGGPAAAGSAVTNSDGTVTISGNGADIWGDTDQCTYYYTWATSSQWALGIKVDADISGGTSTTWAKCEVMCRESDPVLGPQSSDPFIAALYTRPTSNNGVGYLNLQFRSNRSEEADEYTGGKAVTGGNYTPPVWIQLVRNGNVFSCEYSYDGSTWVDEVDVDTSTAFEGNDDPNEATFAAPFPNTVTVGIAVTSHDNTASDTASVPVTFVTNTVPAFTAPTALVTTVPNKNCTNYAGCEASFSFQATNNATPYIPFLMGNLISYQWYRNGAAVAGATGTSLTWLIDPSDATQNGTQTYCLATLAAPWNATVKSVYSTTNSLTVMPGVVYHTNGVKLEYFANALRADVENGNVGPATWIGAQPAFDNPGNLGINYVTRESGWFIPPATDKYVFFVATDDDSDLWLSSDSTMAKKQVIAQEEGWSPYDSWLTSGDGAATSAAQKRSDQWTLDATGVNPPNAAGIALTQGEPYYIELDHHQGGGGDVFSVTYQTVAQINSSGWTNEFSNGSPTLIAGTNGNIMLASWTPTYLKWSQTPASVNVSQAASGTFNALAVSDGEFTPLYQWYRAGQPLSGATTTTYTTPITSASDNGAQFFVVATEPESTLSITSSVVTLAVESGIWEPGFAKVEWWYTNDTAQANNLAALESGSLGLPGLTVAAPQVEARAINNTGPNYDNGRISCWVTPPTSGPYTFYVCSDDQSDLFLSTDATVGNKQMIATETAWSNPLSWVSSAGSSTLSQKCSDGFIPTGGTTAQYPNGIRLSAGQKYYLELDHYNGTGGDNCEATMTPTGSPPADGSASTLAGNSIGYYFPRCTYVAFTQQPVSVTNAAPFAPVTFTATGVTDSQIGIMGADYPESGLTNFMFFQWTVNGTAVPGANTSSFTMTANPWQNNAQIACQMRAIGYANAAGATIWSNSATAVLTVASNSTTPAITYASILIQNGGADVLDIRFNKPMDPGSLLNATYSVSGLQVASPNVFTNGENAKYLSPGSKVLGSDQYASVQLGVFNIPSTFPYSLTVTGAKDAWGNALTANTASVVQAPLTDTDIGTPPNDPEVSGLLWVNGPNSYTIQCEGSDIWNGADGCNFAWQQVSGDFDVVVQVLDSTHTDGWQKSALMVRQSLDSGSREWSIVTTPDSSDNIAPGSGNDGNGVNNILSYCRNAEGGSSTAWTYGDSAAAPNNAGYYNMTPSYPNVWLRLKRVGQQLYSFYGVDGIHWIPSGTDNPSLVGDATALTDPVYIGIAQTAHANDSTTATPAWGSLLCLAEDDYTNYNAKYVEPTVAPVVVAGTPAITFATFYTNNNLSTGPAQVVDIQFNKPMSPASLLAATYTIPGLTVAGVSVYTNGSFNLSPTSEAANNSYSSVLLTVTGTPKFPLAITVTGATDASGTALVSPGNATSASLCALINQDIGAAGDPSVPGVMLANGTNSYTIVCEGSDQWNAADGFNFSYTELTGDFDVVVRVKSTTHTSDWSKAGLMVRETLTPGSRDWNIVNDPDSSDGIMATDSSGTGASAVECNCRNTTAGSSGGWQVVTNGMAPAYPNAWLRLQRSGTQLAAYYSTDGTNWTQHGWDDPTTVGDKTPLPATVYVGISQSAHDNDDTPMLPFQSLVYLDTAEYDNFNAAYVSTAVTQGKLTITRSGSNVVISWAPAGGTLYSSPALGKNADWTPVANPTNPMTIPIGTTSEYYRLQY